MSAKGIRSLPEFNPSDAGATEWELYKRDFLIHIDALGLDDKPGRRKVGVLLSNMGRECVKIYDSFVWAPEVRADEDRGIEHREAEDKYNLNTVLAKFDHHFGVHNFRNIKRQEFLSTKRGNMSVMDFIAELQRKAEYCQYGDHKDGFICDMIINGINDKKCSEKLMEIPAAELTLDRVIQTCRHIELTKAHIKTLESPEVHVAQRIRQGQQRSRQSFANTSYCQKCCRVHVHRRCPAYNRKCDTCGQVGHFKASKLCQGRATHRRGQYRGRFPASRGRGRDRGGTRVHYTEEDEFSQMFDQCASTHDVYTANIDNGLTNHEWTVKLNVQNKDLFLEIDSGAQCNVLSRKVAEKFRAIATIERSDAHINGVSGNKIKAFGKVTLPCEYKNTRHDLTFQVIDTQRNINLLGREDSVKLGLIMRINNVKLETEQLIQSFSDVLGDQIGCLPGEYDMKIDETITPVVHSPRAVPVAIRDELKQQLDLLERSEIIVRETEPTEWVNSMVCVRKKNGKVRICIDPTDLNKAILREHYPMNTIDEVATRLHGSKYFTTLDANMGYYQVKLSEKSSKLTTFNTPFGRYRYLRMPMGARCSSEVFQREMEKHFGAMEGVEIVVDDILVHGKTLEEHNKRLKTVLEKARSINLKLNKEKCVFAKPEVNYVGHKLTGEGLKPTDERVAAILKMKEPENQSELLTVLGMLSYVAKFIPGLSELNAPLRDLKNQEVWEWSPEASEAFAKIKETLTSTKVLRYFNVSKPVTLTVDASMRGLGAAVIQSNGVVAYASRALTSAEQKYAQIEKEMLAVVFGCERFHKLLYGNPSITIESDHKPLENIMKKPIHAAPLRIQRMMLKLQPYEFTLIHKKGKEMGLADCLSRMPLNENAEQTMDDELMVLVAETLSCTNHDKIATATAEDEQLQIVKQIVIQGWPESRSEVHDEAKPFWEFRDEISVYNGVLYRGQRVCIPMSLRAETLKAIHKAHLGIVNCKKRAKELVYWPGMNKQIEDVVNKCSVCLTYKNKPAKEPMVMQEIPSLPWSKVGTDLFEVNGYHYLIMVDYYSNFIEVAPLKQDTSTSTIVKNMKANIARYGVMDTLVSDNGPQFASREFKDFVEAYGINHVTSSPLYQQSNGLAERAVQTVKNLTKKCFETGDDIYLCLLELRNTPRDDEIGSPMQRLMGRRAKTLIPMSKALRKPEAAKAEKVASKLTDYRWKQKYYYDRHTKAKDDLKPGDAVRIKTPTGWKPAEYVSKTRYPRSHVVKAGESGREYRRNTSMLMKTRETPHIIESRNESLPFPVVQSSSQNTGNTMQSKARNEPPEKSTHAEPGISSGTPVIRSRYGREIKKPSYLKDYEC